MALDNDIVSSINLTLLNEMFPDKTEGSPISVPAEVPVAPGGEQVPDWLKGLRSAEVEPVAPGSVIEAPVVAEVVVDAEEQARAAAASPVEPAPPAPPAPVLSVEEQYAKLGEPMMRVRAAREADRAGLPERQRKFLDSRVEVQRAAGEAAEEAGKFRLEDDQRSRLEGLQGKLGVLHDRVTPLPDSLVAEKAGRRGALSEADVVVRQETVAKWNEEIVCQQAVLESLDVEGKARATQEAADVYNGLAAAKGEAGSQARKAARQLAKAEKALAPEQERMKILVDMGGLTAEEAKLVLEQKPAYQQKAAAKLKVALLELEAAWAEQRAAEARAKAEELRAEEEAARAAAGEVEGLIGQRRAGIDMAVADMTVSDGVTKDTRQRLEKAGERIGRSQTETNQKLEANLVAGDIQEMQAFVDKIAGVRILPGGLDNQLRLLDQRIDYLRQPGTIENLEPALAGAVEDAVDAFGGGDAGREKYLAKLLGDRTNLQILRDIANNPAALEDSPGVPAVLKQAVREAQVEAVRREQKQEGGAGVGFLEGGSDDKTVNSLYELRRGVAAKFVESLGLTAPAGLAEQEHLRQVGADLRTMLEAEEAPEGWGEIYKRMDIREEGKKNVAEAEARVAEAQKRVDELTAELEKERTAGGEREAELQQQLTAAQAEADEKLRVARTETEAERQRAEALAPVAGEVGRQIQGVLAAVPKEAWDLIPDDQRQEFSLGLQPGETIEERRTKIQAAAEKAVEAGLGLEGKENDAAHQAGVVEVLDATNDYYAGKLSAEKAADRLKKWRSKKVGGVGGVGGREKTAEELQAASLQIAGAEMEQMRRAKNLSKDQAQNVAQRAGTLNAALEGTGVLTAAAGGLLDAGFKLALESMFSTGGR